MDRKIIYLLISIILITITAVNAAVIDNVSIDNIDFDNYDEVKLVEALEVVTPSIVTAETKNPIINRGDFAGIVCKMLGLKELPDINISFYEDVNSNTKNAGYIYAATQLGLFGGVGNGKFNPDSDIAQTSAIKVLVSALGYDVLAATKGGWPYGYIAVASELGLTKNLNINLDSYLSYNEAAVLVYNALNTNIMVNEGNGKFTRTDEKLLYKALKVSKYSGQVTGTNRAVLIGTEKINNGYVTIDGVLYNEGKSDVSKYFGYVVDFYYNFNEKDEKVILSVIPVKGAKEINIYPDDLEKDDNKFNENNIVYTDFDGVRTELSARIKLACKNGSRINFSIGELDIGNGNYKFIDSDGDGVFDTVIINEYDNYVVETATNTKIFDKYGKQAIDIGDENDNIIDIYLNDKKISTSDLKEWDVISVQKSTLNSKNYISIIVSRIQQNGSITEFEKEGNRLKWLFVDDFPYKLDYSYLDESMDNPIYDMYINDNAVFLLDYHRIIVGVKDVNRDKELYGYLLKTGTKYGLDTKYQIKVIDEKGGEKVHTLSKKIFYIGYDEKQTAILNGEYDVATVYDILYGISKENDFVTNNVTKIISYKLNGDGLIDFLKTANAIDKDIEDGLNTYYEANAGNGLVYRPSTKSFHGYVGIDKDTKVFVVRNLSSGVDVKTFKSDYFTGENTYHLFKALNVDKYGVANIIIKYSDSIGGGIELDSPFFVLDKVTNAVNDDGENVIRLNGYYNFVYKKFDIIDEQIFSGLIQQNDDKPLKRGDIIQVTINGSNEVVDALLLKLPLSVPVSRENDKGEIAFGEIIAKKKDRIMLRIGLRDNGTPWSSSKKISKPYTPLTKAYVYDSVKDKIEIIEPEQIEKGWMAIIHGTYTRPFEIICFPHGIN